MDWAEVMVVSASFRLLKLSQGTAKAGVVMITSSATAKALPQRALLLMLRMLQTDRTVFPTGPQMFTLFLRLN
jgi:hypothetical protein